MEVKTPPKRVLVVDDEAHIANTLAAMLRDRGYEAAAAYDAVGGLAHCEACPPDLIISDVVMPGMNGVELAMVVKQLFPACKVLLVSELATSADFLKHARRNGYDFELLAKPLHLSQLLARVEALT
jgi:DNA-binding response OmpR family regulator